MVSNELMGHELCPSPLSLANMDEYGYYLLGTVPFPGYAQKQKYYFMFVWFVCSSIKNFQTVSSRARNVTHLDFPGNSRCM